MQAIRQSHVPVLAAYTSGHRADVEDEFTADLVVRYVSFEGPRQPVTWPELTVLGLTHRTLRRTAAHTLEAMAGAARLHGSPPAFMVSFHGIESSLLLVDEFWQRLALDLPGDIVVGVPARDVLVITGSRSAGGLAKARRCVERVFFAGDDHLLSQELLVWRNPGWEVFDPAPESAVEDVGEWIPEDRRDNAREWIPEHLAESVATGPGGDEVPYRP